MSAPLSEIARTETLTMCPLHVSSKCCPLQDTNPTAGPSKKYEVVETPVTDAAGCMAGTATMRRRRLMFGGLADQGQ